MNSRAIHLMAQGISFGHQKQNPLFHNLDFAIEGGESIALTGSSGSGKSTLLYLLSSLLTPNTGKIIFNNEEVSRMSDAQRSQLRNTNYGFVFQDYMLDRKRTAISNILEPKIYAKSVDLSARQRAINLLEEMGVGDLQDRRTADMSGGQAQRVAVCRALIGNPCIIFADEPTGNLDIESAQAVIDGLLKVCDIGGCLIVATHDESVRHRLSRSIVLANT